MTMRKSYKSNGTRMANSFETGALVSRHQYPMGTMTAIDCPDCPALVGKKCISAHGTELSQTHISRRRMAIRKYRADQEAPSDPNG